ncbi:MAG: hypothetical protein KJ620_00975 [Candidatus Edwardsbacteria bacterium]|nr:hypothetical protein [Candidatus Edwardsbacteria bacterium]MBU2463528.1 hypothetical protein [Candidatus Edwardsbacteria bacterium]MBU2595153.1 hypothetical protein [Candidatus Edwardsbacteria bacterium]
MIDTLRIRIKLPTIHNNSRLTLVPVAQRFDIPNPDRVLHVMRPGAAGPQTIREVYLHQDFVNITSFADYLMVAISLPKFFRRDASTIEPISLSETFMALGRLHLWLRETAGVSINIMEAEVSRLDLFSNARSGVSFGEYRPLFEVLNFGRGNPQRYHSTFYLITSQRTVCIYDKSAVMTRSEQEVVGPLPKIIRWEVRLKRARAIHQALRIRTVADLLSEWENLKDFYLGSVRDTMRLSSAPVLHTEVRDLRAEIAGFMSKPKDKRGLTYWLLANGARHIAGRYPQLGNVKEVLKELGYQNYQISRFLESLATLQFRPLLGDAVDINQLRNELYEKLKDGLERRG